MAQVMFDQTLSSWLNVHCDFVFPQVEAEQQCEVEAEQQCQESSDTSGHHQWHQSQHPDVTAR